MSMWRMFDSRAGTPIIAASAATAAAPAGSLVLDANLFQIVTVALGVFGVILSRLVFVGQENRKLGRAQTIGEILPLTGVALVLALPLMVKYRDSIVLAPMIGCGIGYSTMLFLKLSTRIAIGVFRSAAQEIVDALKDTPTAETPSSEQEAIDRAMDAIDKMDEVKPKR